MVLCLCRNKSSQNGTKICKDFISIIRIYGAKTRQRGAPGWAQPTRARPPLLVRPGGLYPPGGPADDPPDTIKSHYSRKNQGERIIAIHETEPPPGPVLPREGRSGVCLGLRRGGGVFDLRHHQPISIANSMMLPTGSE